MVTLRREAPKDKARTRQTSCASGIRYAARAFMRWSILVFSTLLGCGGATNAVSPQPVTLTAASVGPAASAVEGRSVKVMVGDKGMLAMVQKNGCLSIVYETKKGDEMAVQCPKADRIAVWLAANDPIALRMPLAKLDEQPDEIPLPAAQIMNAEGDVYNVTRKEDVQRLLGSVRALSKELASEEEPKPGPSSPMGWQMMRVAGPAHVGVAGTIAQGTLDARVSSSGQYLCEFSTEGLHAKKSGVIPKDGAPRALDEILGPFQASAEKSKTAYVAAYAKGEEKRANSASSREVIDRFGHLQDVLGDACLPELEGPAPIGL